MSPFYVTKITMKRNVKLGVIQMRCGSLEHGLEMVEKAAKLGAEVICLPELFNAPYFCQIEDHKFFELAEPIPGPSTEALAEVARKNNVVLVGSLFEKRMPGLYHNTAVILDADGKYLGKYRKMHIPDDPLYYEKFYFTPGDLGFKTWQTSRANLGVCICWDQWYPEAARLTALQGSEILFYPTAIGWHPSEKAEFGVRQHSAWETIQRSHAIANGCYVAVPNRIGTEYADGDPKNGDGIEFWGGSFICDPSGQIIAKASHDAEEILIAEVNLDAVGTQRTHWPFFRDRRIDAYGNILQRALVDEGRP